VVGDSDFGDMLQFMRLIFPDGGVAQETGDKNQVRFTHRENSSHGSRTLHR
jgi:hypothetical protein